MLVCLLMFAVAQSPSPAQPQALPTQLRGRDAPVSAADAEREFNRLDVARADFMKFQLRVRGPELGAALKRRSNELKDLEARYRAVVDVGVPRWSVAALVRIGELYWHFADAVDASPTPPEVRRMGDEAVAAYRDQLSEGIEGHRARAREAWKAAEAKARELDVTSPELLAVQPLMNKP